MMVAISTFTRADPSRCTYFLADPADDEPAEVVFRRSAARLDHLRTDRELSLPRAGLYRRTLARIIHERFCCNRGFAATTSQSAGVLAA
jgi:hypothetical protein